MHEKNSMGFYRLPQIIGDQRRGIQGVIPMARSTWYKGVQLGIYPKPVKHGHMSLWPAEDIIALIEKMKSTQ